MPIKLCHINELEDPGSRGFTLTRYGREFLMFLVKKDGKIYGYENRCPHAGINLEWREDDFLDLDKALIICSVHGALFTIDSGSCVVGPCNGRGLNPLDLHQDTDGFIYLND